MDKNKVEYDDLEDLSYGEYRDLVDSGSIEEDEDFELEEEIDEELEDYIQPFRSMKKEVEVKDPLYKQIPIKGLTGYRISKKGVILSPRNRILKSREHSTVKYKIIGLKGKQYWIHDLIMLTYVGPKKKGMIVAHKDGSKRSELDNLEYSTQVKNMIAWSLKQRRKNK